MEILSYDFYCICKTFGRRKYIWHFINKDKKCKSFSQHGVMVNILLHWTTKNINFKLLEAKSNKPIVKLQLIYIYIYTDI